MKERVFKAIMSERYMGGVVDCSNKFRDRYKYLPFMARVFLCALKDENLFDEEEE